MSTIPVLFYSSLQGSKPNIVYMPYYWYCTVEGGTAPYGMAVSVVANFADMYYEHSCVKINNKVSLNAVQ
jgi:hypothetical protein